MFAEKAFCISLEMDFVQLRPHSAVDIERDSSRLQQGQNLTAGKIHLRPINKQSTSTLAGNTHDYHCILYVNMCWSALSERRDLHWRLFVHKALIGDLPHYLSVVLCWSAA